MYMYVSLHKVDITRTVTVTDYLFAWLQDGSTCLHLAAQYRNFSAVRFLCELGNDKLMAMRDKGGASPLARAQAAGAADIAEYLKSVGMQA
jgi:ankyrin repeat protein